MVEIFPVALVIGAAWFWFACLRAREAAVDAARRACTADGVQLLDDTVALASFRPQRTSGGSLALRRIYRFEFTDTGNNRLGGSVTLLGPAVQALYLEPHAGHVAGQQRSA
jgi:hypothetical protein